MKGDPAVTRHNRIDLSGRRGGGSLPLYLLLALAPAAFGCFPGVSYALDQQMKRAFHVWPALCWHLFVLLAAAAYLTAAAILCAHTRSSGGYAGAAALGAVLLVALGLITGLPGALSIRLFYLFIDADAFGVTFAGQVILAAYLLVRWLRYR